MKIKIGDEVRVRGIVDEIRKDIVIIRNNGGYFGTVPEEIEKTGWIPCSDRLPEKWGYYLTTTMYGEVYCDYWAGVNFGRQEAVIAWAALPEPYKPR